jgi:hypothetical protein
MKKNPARSYFLKYALILFACLNFWQSGFAQNEDLKEKFAKKGRSQNTLAWVMYATGTATITVAVSLAWGSVWGSNNANDTQINALAIVGSGLTLGSYPLFWSAARNKGRALGFNLGPEEKEYFLAKSKRQEITGWIMVGGGILLSGVLANSHNYSEATSVLNTGSVVLTYAGIFTLSASARNKGKSENFSTKLALNPGIRKNNPAFVNQPGLTMLIDF